MSAPDDFDFLMENYFNDPQANRAFISRLFTSDLFILTYSENELQGESVTEEPQDVQIMMFATTDGKKYIPVFTSLTELQKSIQSECSYMALNGWTLFSMIKGGDVVVNPGNAFGIYFKAADLDDIRNAYSPRQETIEQGAQILLAMPDVDPMEFKKAASAILAHDGRAQAAYFCLMVKGGGADRSFLIGVEFKPGLENNDIFSVISAGVSSYLPTGHSLDFVIMRDGDMEGACGYLLESGDLIFHADSDE